MVGGDKRETLRLSEMVATRLGGLRCGGRCPGWSWARGETHPNSTWISVSTTVLKVLRGSRTSGC